MLHRCCIFALMLVVGNFQLKARIQPMQHRKTMLHRCSLYQHVSCVTTSRRCVSLLLSPMLQRFPSPASVNFGTHRTCCFRRSMDDAGAGSLAELPTATNVQDAAATSPVRPPGGRPIESTSREDVYHACPTYQEFRSKKPTPLRGVWAQISIHFRSYRSKQKKQGRQITMADAYLHTRSTALGLNPASTASPRSASPRSASTDIPVNEQKEVSWVRPWCASASLSSELLSASSSSELFSSSSPRSPLFGYIDPGFS